MARRNHKYVNKFKLPKMLEYEKVSLAGVPRNWDKPKEAFLMSPKTLVELAGDVMDSEPLPECMYWNNSQVLEWVADTLGLPEYKETFETNLVTGRQLILIGPNHLIKMKICKWDHIKLIMEEIRRLYRVPMPKFAVDLSKPVLSATEYDWETLYYRYISQMTLGSAMTRLQYWRLAKLMNTLPEPVCHWYSMMTEQDNSQERIVVARTNKTKKRERLFVPMFSENHYVPTTIYVYYLDGDPLAF